jgi:hypothetical protein
MLAPNERLAVNQEVLREVNEHIRGVAGLSSSIFICECSDAACLGTLELRLEEFDRIRSNPTWFILKPAHAEATIEAVLEEHAEYLVVEAD